MTIRLPVDDRLRLSGSATVIQCDGSTPHGFKLAEGSAIDVAAEFGTTEEATRRLRVKRCAVCSVRFLADWSVVTCSPDCQRQRHAAQVGANNQKRAARRKLRTHCAICGGEIKAVRASRKYCSPRCRQAEVGGVIG